MMELWGRLSWMCSYFMHWSICCQFCHGIVRRSSFRNAVAAKKSTGAMFVRALRLLRMLKAEQYTEAFTVLDDVVRAQSDVLIVTGFTAIVFWVFFSTLMYYAERNNPDPEMRYYYYSIPDAMWMTLLNLSGESPTCVILLHGVKSLPASLASLQSVYSDPDWYFGRRFRRLG